MCWTVEAWPHLPCTSPLSGRSTARQCPARPPGWCSCTAACASPACAACSGAQTAPPAQRPNSQTQSQVAGTWTSLSEARMRKSRLAILHPRQAPLHEGSDSKNNHESEKSYWTCKSRPYIPYIENSAQIQMRSLQVIITYSVTQIMLNLVYMFTSKVNHFIPLIKLFSFILKQKPVLCSRRHS